MGTWDTGLFDDDIALDVRDEYLALLASTGDARRATELVLAPRASELADRDEGPVIWLALAATQWKYGAFGTRVLDQALHILRSGAGLERWSGDPRLLARRQKVLTRLQDQLQGPLPPARRPRRRKETLPPPGTSVVAPDGRAKATVFQLALSTDATQRSQVICEMDVGSERGGGHVAVLSCPWTEVTLRWDGTECFVVQHPPGALVIEGPGVDAPKTSAFYSGRRLTVRYEARPT